MARLVLATIVALATYGCGVDEAASSFGLVSRVEAQDPPAFLSVGSTYDVSTGMTSFQATIVEIDAASGWIRTDDDVWLNLATLVAIGPPGSL